MANHEEVAPVPVIYLDQNHWIELLKASKNGIKDSPDKKLLERIRDGVRGGLYVCALSGSHYHETWHRARKESRHALAHLMRELTNYVTLAPYQTVRLHENTSLLVQLNESGGHLTSQARASREAVIGRGVDHAFSSDTGRFRFVASIATDEQPEGEPVDAPDEFVSAVSELKEHLPEKYEWISLAGFDEHPEIEGFELYTQRRRGQEFADSRKYFSAQVSERRKHNSENVRRFLLTEFAQNVLEDLVSIARSSSMTVPLLESWGQIQSVIRAMPSCDVLFQLIQSRQRNQQKPWEPNDLGDLSFLSVAIPYADIILTERQWAALARTEKLAARYDTHITHSRSNLLTILERGWPHTADSVST